jgi:ABC-type uncharacterized transport system substrate-binding protein
MHRVFPHLHPVRLPVPAWRRWVAGIGLALCLAGQAVAAEIWVALSGREAVYQEFAEALRAALPGDKLEVRAWSEFNPRQGSPDLIVAVGSEALRQLLPYADKTPILSALVPRNSLDALNVGGKRLTSLYYEQPFARQAALVRAAFPDKPRVGLVLGPITQRYRATLEQTLLRQGLEPVIQQIDDKSEMTDAFQTLLTRADVFLALPDPDVIHSQSAKFILLASYRQGVPVVGFSAAFVKSGAAVAVVSSAPQNAVEAAKMAREILSGRKWPGARAPAEYNVVVNPSVSRSLGLDLDAQSIEQRLHGDKGD